MRIYAIFITLSLLLTAATTFSQVPNILNYQGRVAVGNVNFDGTGSFKFALVNTNGSTTYWSNDGTSTAGSEPAASVTLTVIKGLYSVLLGDSSLSNMAAIPVSVFGNTDLRLRVWFNDGSHGSQMLSPDQRLVASPYAVVAGTANALTPQTTNQLVSVLGYFGPMSTGYYANILAPFKVVYNSATRPGPGSSLGAVGGSDFTTTLSGRSSINVAVKKIVGLSSLYSIGNATVFAQTGSFQVLPGATATIIRRASDGTESVLDTLTMSTQGANITASHVLDLTLDWSDNSYYIDVSLTSGNYSATGSQISQTSFFALQKLILSSQ